MEKKKNEVCTTFHGISNDELLLILEMINGGSFSGHGVEKVATLKTKVLAETDRRGLNDKTN